MPSTTTAIPTTGPGSTGGEATTGDLTSTGAVASTGMDTGDATTTGTDLPGEAGWRSVLYPEDWTPEFTGPEGRFLHDFSYAGYHNGETPLAVDVPALTIDVVADHGADPGGQVDATAAFQAALDGAAQAGGVVHVPAGLYRIDGSLTLAARGWCCVGSGPSRASCGSRASRAWRTRAT